VVGVVLSVIWLVYRSTAPGMPVLGRARDTHDFRNIEEHPEDEVFPGILVLRLDGSLFFVTADALGDRVRELEQSAETPVRAIVLDCESVDFIDSQGSEQVGELAHLAHESGRSFRLARIHAGALAVLERDGVTDAIGADHIHKSVNQAVEAEIAAPQPEPAA
jgi:sulfate permease, SulP family